MADTIDTLIAQIKKMQKKIDEMEAAGKNTEAMEAKIDALEKKLNRSTDFGDWDE